MSWTVRLLGLLTGFAAPLLLALRLLDRAGVPYATIGPELGTNMMQRIPAAQLPAGIERDNIILLGDSTMIAAPAGGALADRLQETMERRRPATTVVHSLASYGISPFEYFALIDRIAAIPPSLVILGVNLQMASDAMRRQWSRAEVYGWLEPRHWPEALRLPLQDWNLTLDQLLMSAALAHSPFRDAWMATRREQVRTGTGMLLLREIVQKQAPSWLSGQAPGLARQRRVFADAERRRFSRGYSERLYAKALSGLRPDEPMLQVLRADLARFRGAGIPVLVYVVPLNFQYLRKLGIGDLDGIAASARSVCRVASEEAASCLDLHDRFADSWFADAGGHLTTTAAQDGMARLAALLEPEVLRRLGAGAAPAVVPGQEAQ